MGDTAKIVRQIREKSSHLDRLIGQDRQVRYLKSVISGEIEIGHMLLYGPPGTGKTSSVLAFAREYLGSDFRSNFMELNASNQRGIETIRGKVLAFARARKKGTRCKLLLMDEFEYLTPEAQAALRRIMEVYNANVKFLLTANDISRIDPAIFSRIVPLKYALISREIVAQHLRKNGVITHPSMLDYVGGDFRKIAQILAGNPIQHSGTSDNFLRLFSGPLSQTFMDEIQGLFASNPPHDEICKSAYRHVKKSRYPAAIKLELVYCVALFDWRVKYGANPMYQAHKLVRDYRTICANYTGRKARIDAIGNRDT